MRYSEIAGYKWNDALLNSSHDYLLPATCRELERLSENYSAEDRRVFELGCGNGSIANALTEYGWDVTGIDPSIEGITQANAYYPHLKLYEGSAYDDLAAHYGQFPVVTSLEVVEHVFFPRKYAATVFSLVEPGGIAIISTPYHSYWKNLALAVSGKLDSHFTALWDYGHIKFWSFKTLSALLEEAGFGEIRFMRVGRIPILAKSMIAIAKKMG